jgi:ATP-dependent DNA helicase RecQ
VADDVPLALLRQLTANPAAVFRDGQREAIEALAVRRERVLMVQRTGWGKSAVYFVATAMLRRAGRGPTLLVSPLLALMRNQVAAAQRLGIRAATINSGNTDEWDEVHELVRDGLLDVLLVSPERFANREFVERWMPLIGSSTGMLVIDEVHCISDWGHDFRPHYRRIGRIVEGLPSGIPVLGCTATANSRVVDDVVVQLGSNLTTVRGPLARPGLRLGAHRLPSKASRLAWVTEFVRATPGTGIVYCLTQDDTEVVSEFLRAEGIAALPYHGGMDEAERLSAEQALLGNELRALVATSALGMGYDKPDVSFVVHFQTPGSPVAYYQQVGRAGRDLHESHGVLLSGEEDESIQDWFIDTAFPPESLTVELFDLLSASDVAMRRTDLLRNLNIKPAQLDAVLVHLEVDGAVLRDGQGWSRTLSDWAYPTERVEQVTALRRQEQQQMVDYLDLDTCRMQFLQRLLDDPADGPCGICDNCNGQPDPVRPTRELLARAERHLRRRPLIIEPRRRWQPGSGRSPATLGTAAQFSEGRVLCRWGDPSWGDLVRDGKQMHRRFADELVHALAELVRDLAPDPAPTWVTCVPSRRNPELVPDLAARLAHVLSLAFHPVVELARDTAPQKSMRNGDHQAANVLGAYVVPTTPPEGPVLLVDDLVDSRWTLTEVAYQLRSAGSGPVYPVVLATTAGRST